MTSSMVKVYDSYIQNIYKILCNPHNQTTKVEYCYEMTWIECKYCVGDVDAWSVKAFDERMGECEFVGAKKSHLKQVHHLV